MTTWLLSVSLLASPSAISPAANSSSAVAVQGTKTAAPEKGISVASNDRRDAIAKVLTNEAKDKLKQASHDVLVELAPTPVGTDPAPSARKVLARLFTGLTQPQLDVLTFYTLVDAGHTAANEDVLDKSLGAEASKLTKAEVNRLHHLLTDRTGYVASVDRLRAKIATVADRVVENVK